MSFFSIYKNTLYHQKIISLLYICFICISIQFFSSCTKYKKFDPILAVIVSPRFENYHLEGSLFSIIKKDGDFYHLSHFEEDPIKYSSAVQKKPRIILAHEKELVLFESIHEGVEFFNDYQPFVGVYATISYDTPIKLSPNINSQSIQNNLTEKGANNLLTVKVIYPTKYITPSYWIYIQIQNTDIRGWILLQNATKINYKSNNIYTVPTLVDQLKLYNTVIWYIRNSDIAFKEKSQNTQIPFPTTPLYTIVSTSEKIVVEKLSDAKNTIEYTFLLKNCIPIAKYHIYYYPTKTHFIWNIDTKNNNKSFIQIYQGVKNAKQSTIYIPMSNIKDKNKTLLNTYALNRKRYAAMSIFKKNTIWYSDFFGTLHVDFLTPYTRSIIWKIPKTITSNTIRSLIYKDTDTIQGTLSLNYADQLNDLIVLTFINKKRNMSNAFFLMKIISKNHFTLQFGKKEENFSQNTNKITNTLIFNSPIISLIRNIY